jgi:hypothetical protein
MKSILRVVLCLVPLLAIGLSAFAQCSVPSAETIALTWPPGAVVQVLPDPSSFYAAQNAISNWNTASIFACYSPYFTFGPGTGPFITVNYVFIPSDPNSTSIPRGKTTINSSGRITSAYVLINDLITPNFPLTLNDIMNHEMGHTMGLGDCNYPGCPLQSSVMVSKAPYPIWYIYGPPPPGGPTNCDLGVMMAVAQDYAC